MRIEILQTHKLLASCEQALAERYTVHKLHEAADKDALLAELAPRLRAIAGGNVGPELMDRLPQLEIIANFGVGYDSIDTAAARARNIRVTNTPDVLNDAMTLEARETAAVWAGSGGGARHSSCSRRARP